VYIEGLRKAIESSSPTGGGVVEIGDVVFLVAFSEEACRALSEVGQKLRWPLLGKDNSASAQIVQWDD
jgi:hypothetical protein